jgi:prepilin-type N-terminal cleavage/methylation domain-containing protein
MIQIDTRSKNRRGTKSAHRFRKAVLGMRRGYTMVEMLVVIFIFTIIWGVIAQALVTVYRTQGYAMDQSRAINEARKGVDSMAKEIRQAQYGDNGAYPTELAADKEFVFYSDIDGDGRVERVRYYLATVNSGTQTQQCVSTATGGSCSVTFSNFLTGTLTSAQVQVSLEGYFGASGRTASVVADGTSLATMCASGCNQCAAAWQGTQTFDVTSQAADNSITLTATGTSLVKNQCSWQTNNHSLLAFFVFSWTEDIPNQDNTLKKGVIKPTGSPVTYPAGQEKITTVSSYVRNAPPIFSYYDSSGNQLTSNPATVSQTTMMKLFMVVNVDPNRPPSDYQLEQYVQLRNLKKE